MAPGKSRFGNKKQVLSREEQTVVLLRSKLLSPKRYIRYPPEVKAGEPNRIHTKVLSGISNKSRKSAQSTYPRSPRCLIDIPAGFCFHMCRG